MRMTKLKVTVVLMVCVFVGVGTVNRVVAQPPAGKTADNDSLDISFAEVAQAKAALERATADYEHSLRNLTLREIDVALNALKKGPPDPQTDLELLRKIKKAVEAMVPPEPTPYFPPTLATSVLGH